MIRLQKIKQRGTNMSEKIRPFVKWAGGKGNLISQLNHFYPPELKNGVIKRYIEPFVGGGAVLIDILQNYQVQEAYAFDINIDLINAYHVVRDHVEELIANLKKIEKEYLLLNQEKRKEYFYQLRDKYNSNQLKENEKNVQKATELIYLNRTCFNGLYRVNKAGKFNVPVGSYQNPTICDEENLRNLSKLIQHVKFQHADYQKSIEYVTENTFIYFDPPYRPLNITSGFTSYTKENFDDENQKELAMIYRKLNEKKTKLMLSNSNPKNSNENDTFFEELYEGFSIHEICASRMINANAKARGKITEIVITNYH